MTARDEGPADGLSLEGLYRTHAVDVARFAYHLAGPQFDVDDLVQEVFLVAHRRLGSLRKDPNLKAWLYALTANVVRWRRRTERVRRIYLGRFREVELIRETPRPHAVRNLEQRELSAALYAILDRMPDKYRSIFVMSEMEELPSAEIAIVTGLTQGAVRVRLHRARALFFKLVEARSDTLRGLLGPMRGADVPRKVGQ